MNFSATAKELTKGFQLQHPHSFDVTYYAVYQDGTILESDRHPRGNEFAKNRDWKKVDALPEEREFIGNYYMPSIT